MTYDEADALIREHIDYGGSIDVHALAVAIASEEAAGSRSLTLTGAQILEAFNYVAPDYPNDPDQLEHELTIQHGDGHSGAGMYCWFTDYPDEGSLLLDGTIATPAAPVAVDARDEREAAKQKMIDRAREYGMDLGDNPVAYEFYNAETGHAIVDYTRWTHVGHLTDQAGYEARPLVYARVPAKTDAAGEPGIVGPLRDDQRQRAISLYMSLPHSLESVESVITMVSASAYANGAHDAAPLRNEIRERVETLGQWVHCSPALLNAGVSCANTPRRACACEPENGGHDHFIAHNAPQSSGQQAALTDEQIVALADLHFDWGKVCYVNADKHTVVAFVRALLQLEQANG